MIVLEIGVLVARPVRLTWNGSIMLSAGVDDRQRRSRILADSMEFSEKEGRSDLFQFHRSAPHVPLAMAGDKVGWL